MLGKDFLGALGHGNQAGDSEAAGTNGNEHARTEALFWQFLSHQPVDKRRVHHQRHHEADALKCEAADDDGKCPFGSQLRRQYTCVRANDQKRIRGEDPNRGHLANGKILRGPSAWLSIVTFFTAQCLQSKVYSHRKCERYCAIHPEENLNCIIEPIANVWETVLGDVD